MNRQIPGPYEAAEMQRFLDTFLYTEEAFFVDEVTRLDPEAKEVEAQLDTTRELPLTRLQRTDARHPGHVSSPRSVWTNAAADQCEDLPQRQSVLCFGAHG